MKNFTRNVLALLAAFIWGTAFVGQSVSAERIGAFTFNFARSIIATITLIIVSIVFDRLKKPVQKTAEEKRIERRSIIRGGVWCGVLIAIASNLQQIGLVETSAGKAGFITTLYVVLVPVFAIFIGKRAPMRVWIAVAIATVGMYFLCVSEEFTIAASDFLIFLCAIVFTGHILVVDHYVETADAIKMSCVQFITAGILSGIGMLLFEEFDWQGIMSCIGPLLYVGVLSSGVAYTLQIFAQRGADPTVITILLSLESVFSVIAGAVVLKDKMLPREYIGCLLVFVAVMLAQVSVPALKKMIRKKAEG